MSTILIVDDEVKTCELLKRFLESKGYKVITSNNGEDALEKVRNVNPDIMLLDQKMPGMEGMEVLRKTGEINPATMIIICTAYGDLASAIDAIRLNAFDYVLKPVDLEDIHFRVLRCIEKLELQRKVKLYEKMLPVCCVCKKIRDDADKEPGTGEWMTMESYMCEKAKIDVSHGFCPECFKKTYGKYIPRA